MLKAIKKPKELEMALIALRPEYKNTGINAVLISKIIKHIIDDKIERIESNPMLEHNLNIIQQWKLFESEVVKRRQTFKLPIDKVLSL